MKKSMISQGEAELLLDDAVALLRDLKVLTDTLEPDEEVGETREEAMENARMLAEEMWKAI